MVKGVGAGRESGIRTFASKGIEISAIKDVTPIPHNGPKPKKTKKECKNMMQDKCKKMQKGRRKTLFERREMFYSQMRRGQKPYVPWTDKNPGKTRRASTTEYGIKQKNRK